MQQLEGGKKTSTGFTTSFNTFSLVGEAEQLPGEAGEGHQPLQRAAPGLKKKQNKNSFSSANHQIDILKGLTRSTLIKQ